MDANEMKPIAFHQVTFGYREDAPIAQDFSLTLPSQGVVCLYGPSGCGKTTLLRLLAGLEQPRSGRVERPEGWRTAVVFQENRLLPWHTVLHNVTLGAHGQEIQQRAMEILRMVGLTDEWNHYPEELSGGMQRRVALARALAAEADALILDEPFTGLDTDLWTSVAEQIVTHCARKLIVLVTHRIEQAQAMNARVVSLVGPPLRVVEDTAGF